jgi:hypothetical protein
MSFINQQTLPVNPQTKREAIVSLTNELLARRVRFRPYGRNPDHGFDCIGVVLFVGKRLALWSKPVVMPRYAFPPQAEFFELFNEYCTKGSWQPGTIIVMTDKTGKPKHVGILSHQKASGEWKAIGIRPDMPPRFGMFTVTPDIEARLWGLFDYPLISQA